MSRRHTCAGESTSLTRVSTRWIVAALSRLNGSVKGRRGAPPFLSGAGAVSPPPPPNGHGSHDACAVVVPVLPSPIDLEATAPFLEELAALPRVKKGRVAVGLVANRLRPWTRASQQALMEMLDFSGVGHRLNGTATPQPSSTE